MRSTKRIEIFTLLVNRKNNPHKFQTSSHGSQQQPSTSSRLFESENEQPRERESTTAPFRAHTTRRKETSTPPKEARSQLVPKCIWEAPRPQLDRLDGFSFIALTRFAFSPLPSRRRCDPRGTFLSLHVCTFGPSIPSKSLHSVYNML